MRRARGYTLFELSVVIAIIAIVATMSVGVFVKLSKKNELEATTNAVRALVRRARNAAREERAPALVELDAATGEVRAATRETLVLFRFEQDQQDGAPLGGAVVAADDSPKKRDEPPPEFETRGSLGILGHVYGADAIDGRVGLALDFERPGAFVRVPDRPSLSPLEGVAVEAWVYPSKLEERVPRTADDREGREAGLAKRVTDAGVPPTPTPPRSLNYWDRHPDEPPLFTVVRKGRAFELAVTADYAAQVAVTGTVGGAGNEVTWVGRTSPGLLRSGHWSRLSLSFDGREVACSVDGIRHALDPVQKSETLPARLVRDRSPLVVSDPDPERCFVGSIDEVKLQGVIRGERVAIPRSLALLAPAPEIAFDALGGLDPLRHAEPVVFWLSDAPEALQAVEPPAAAPAGTRERKKPSPGDDASARGAVDHEKEQRFGALAQKLGEVRARQVAVELTGSVR